MKKIVLLICLIGCLNMPAAKKKIEYPISQAQFVYGVGVVAAGLTFAYLTTFLRVPASQRLMARVAGNPRWPR